MLSRALFLAVWVFFSGFAHCGDTELDVFEQMLAMGMPTSQAVSGVLANSPESAEMVVSKAFGKDANAMFAITSAALQAAPNACEKIITLAVAFDAKRSVDIINAVAQQAPEYTTKTVELLIAANADNADKIIVQAADALSYVQLERNQNLVNNKMFKSLKDL